VIEHATFAWGKPAPSMVDEVSLGPGGPDGKVGLLSGTAEEAKDMKEVEEEDLPPTLSNIHLNIKPGNLVMVIGGVGSGKSSLVAAMLGLIPVKEGHVSIGGSIAYVAQSAWIMNETVQENVLFGEDMDPVRYQMAMETAQLLPDIGILPKVPQLLLLLLLLLLRVLQLLILLLLLLPLLLLL
jgi:ABC-type multidrug transport system fused ATPase/permease subunit